MSTTPTPLRRLDLIDMPAAARLMRLSFDTALPTLAGLHTPEEDVAYFTDHLFPTTRMFGAGANSLLGFIAVGGGWIHQLYVHPDHHGAGIGRALLDMVKSEATALQLWAFQQNARARRFYERNGFVAVEFTDGAGNEARAPDVRYVWLAPV